MWLFLSGSFLSVVHKDCPTDCLLVRARVKKHISNVFPDAKIVTKNGSDYQFRAVISRKDVAAALVKQVESLNYPNFKNSIRDNGLRHSCGDVWNIMAVLQPMPPYSSDYSAAPPVRRRPLL